MQPDSTPVALITGAGSGLGAAMANRFAQAGWRVIVTDQHADRAETVAAGLAGSGHAARPLDVTESSQWETLAELVDDEYGRIDLLVNNAGVLQDETLGSIDYDSIRLQMEVNALAPLRVAEALLPNLPSGGKIANITSRMGSIGDND